MKSAFIIPQKEHRTHVWAGGTTTELYIFPQHAEYKKMNFDFRLSTATIEAEISDFTALPGVRRTLVLLEGQLSLFHANHHSIVLHPFESDSFLGDWSTTSQGIASDFNIMMRGQTQARHEVLFLKSGETLSRAVQQGMALAYVYQGEGQTPQGHLRKGDLYVLTEGQMYSFRAEMDVVMILVEVRMN